MSDKRSKSPISENTLLGITKDAFGTNFISESDSDGHDSIMDSSDSETSDNYIADDTDEDPSYDPELARQREIEVTDCYIFLLLFLKIYLHLTLRTMNLKVGLGLMFKGVGLGEI